MKIQPIMTDNGVGNKRRCRNRLSAWGIRHITTKPYTPKTNGKAERFNRTSLEEWAYAQPYAQSQERTRALSSSSETSETVGFVKKRTRACNPFSRSSERPLY